LVAASFAVGQAGMVAAILQSVPEAPLLCDISGDSRLLELGADPLSTQI